MGRVLVRAEYVQRLGDGVLNRGRRILDRMVAELRACRVMSRSMPEPDRRQRSTTPPKPRSTPAPSTTTRRSH